MAKYRKKSVIIEAIQWTGDNIEEIINFTGWHESARKKWTWEEYENIVKKEGLKIFTLNGSVKAHIGDYIIKGISGEFYPCDPFIFEKTYEPVNKDNINNDYNIKVKCQNCLHLVNPVKEKVVWEGVEGEVNKCPECGAILVLDEQFENFLLKHSDETFNKEIK